MTARPADAVPDSRLRFLRQRRRMVARAGVTVSAVATLGALLLAPNRLASVRLGGLALAWWVAAAVGVVALAVVVRGLRDRSLRGGWRRAISPAPVALAAAWGSPAAWLGLPALVLVDGTRGLWPVVTLAAGVVVAALLLGGLAARGDPEASTSRLVRRRWPARAGAHAIVGAAEWAVGALFVWAQLAAVREVGAVLGWPRTTVVGVAAAACLAIGLLGRARRLRVAALAGGVAAAGLAVPIVMTALAAGPSWSHAFSTVASRPPVAFLDGDPWTTSGRPVRGPGPRVSLRFTEGQSVAFVTAGRIEITPWEGGTLLRDVAAAEVLALHPGDRLIVPQGMPLRFQSGRRVPDAPDSGPAWVDPPGREGAWVAVIGLGLTALLGLVGLVPGFAAGWPGTAEGRRAVWTAALIAVTGIVLVTGWALYAAWLSPQVYAGGVMGAEIFELPAVVPAFGASGPPLARLALLGLVAGAMAALLAGSHGLPGQDARRGRWPVLVAGAPIAAGGALALTTPVGGWPLLVAALGLAAAAVAPAVILVRWSERATSRGVAAGATVGLACFAGVALVHLAAPLAVGPGWRALLAWPALLAVPAHVAVAWAFRSRRVSPAPGATAPSGAPAPPAAGQITSSGAPSSPSNEGCGCVPPGRRQE